MLSKLLVEELDAVHRQKWAVYFRARAARVREKYGGIADVNAEAARRVALTRKVPPAPPMPEPAVLKDSEASELYYSRHYRAIAKRIGLR